VFYSHLSTHRGRQTQKPNPELQDGHQARVPEHALQAPNWPCGHEVSTKQAHLSSSFRICRIWAVNRSTTHIDPWHSGHCLVTDSSAPGDVELSGGEAHGATFGKPEVELVATALARTNYERRQAPLHNRCMSISILVTLAHQRRVWSANRSAPG